MSSENKEFKTTLYLEGKKTNLLGYELPKSSHYLVLEAINTDSIMKKKAKIIHIAKFKGRNKLVLGKNDESDFIICDTSISIHHANL